ncbi:RND superfamily putative drug exporter [Allocatelliglobosispora scoriae]|uniref:RND superfamily putative drug exporter n=1 Tax=Allocatelliglobosispora scoriae TaxID=643052 RepID=A0A841BI25_9ACTN|nr:MMPL family transporter [Allocatelliglobosispora scoriae]MBB5867275.1 RND superfamily putative drug exporter [Allocatelliglobosispora scoriae]
MSAIENGAIHRGMSAVARATVRRPWWVIAGWLLATITVAVLVVTLGRPTEEDVSLPGSDAQVGRDLMAANFPTATNAAGQIVVKAAAGRVDDPANAAAITAAVARIAAIEHVVGVIPPSAAQDSLSGDGRIGFITVAFDLGPRDVSHDLAVRVGDAAQPARDAGLQAVPAGVLALPDTSTRTSELLGIGIALIVMVIAFGGLVAAGLPLITALITLVCGVGIVGLLGHVASIPSVAATLATMIGLGVGIDYSLFLISRYRALLAKGLDTRAAITATVATSGAAVVFAGGTVVVALSGLAISGVPILTTLGWTAGLVVLFAVLAATTLLPAILVLLGPRLNALPVLRRREVDPDRSGWGRLADRVTRRPLPWAIATGALLLLLAAPTASLHLGQTDASDQPPGSAARTGYELLTEGFGPGSTSPITVVAELDSPATGPQDPRLADLSRSIRATAGVASVEPARLSADGSVVAVRLEPTTAGSDPQTLHTIDTLLHTPVPGMTVHVAGQTAARGALSDMVAERMPYVIAVVVLLSALLLLVAFRAPVLALKAALMNLLSVGAAYGALTAVFAWGWGIGLVGLDGPIPVESYVPMILFALLFGLSMDYEVILLTAVQESWHATGDNRRSVRDGLAGTGKVITSAALIMVCVFASFVLQASPVIKMFGVGMSVAIAVDATIIRGLLVPATMALLGRANWWTPAWTRRGRTHAPTAPEPVPVGTP